MILFFSRHSPYRAADLYHDPHRAGGRARDCVHRALLAPRQAGLDPGRQAARQLRQYRGEWGNSNKSIPAISGPYLVVYFELVHNCIYIPGEAGGEPAHPDCADLQ